jgi:hypothetical protein
MNAKTAQQEPATFNQKVDREFYDEVKRENGGHIPPDLMDAKGNPRQLNTSPADQAYRRKWNAIAATLRKPKSVPKKSIKDVCIPCALKAGKFPPVLLPSKSMGKPVKVGSVPAPTQARKISTTPKAPTPCKLVSSSITCSHGRQAANGVLCVVPDSYGSIGDQIDCKGVLEGGCGQHIEWSISGMWTSTEHGNSASVLAKPFKPALLEGWLGLHHIEPQTYEIQAVACEGDAPSTSIRAYPPDKWSGKIDLGEIRKKIEEWLSHIPIDDEKKEKLEKGWFLGSIEYSEQWKEDPKSNLVSCESAVTGSFDPLFGAELPPVQIYPPGLIPATLQRWLKAGVYVSAEGGVGFEVQLNWNYWPDRNESEYEKTEVSLLGSITGELSLNLFVVDKDVIDAEVSGSTGFKAYGKFVAETPPAVEFGVKWTGLDAAVKINAAWGWIEYDRVYPLIGESDLMKWEHSFGTSS